MAFAPIDSRHSCSRQGAGSRPARGATCAIVRATALLVLPLVLLTGATALRAAPEHDDWTALLENCVITLPHSTAVDYDCFSQRRAELHTYLERLSATPRRDFQRWNESRQLAFLINAYNAWTVELILGAWPDLDSIRDLGSLLRSPWKKSFIPLLGDTVSLDDIEHGMIREPGRFDEPRIHFAVNCASVGCPALRREAYHEDALDAQLEDQTRRFLGDRSRNRLRSGALEVSSLFKWYGDDFRGGWRGSRSLSDFFIAYADALGLTERNSAQLRSDDLSIDFLDYDWNLNTLENSR